MLRLEQLATLFALVHSGDWRVVYGFDLMSVYLGTHGKVELQREFNGGSLFSTINTGDVNVTKKRLALTLIMASCCWRSNKITSTDGTALDFIDSYTDSSVKVYLR